MNTHWIASCAALFLALLLCCAAPARAGFLDQGTMVQDQSTGLQWEKGQSAAAMNWQQALAYCEACTTGGKPDWRLPNKRELESLVDDTRVNPALDPVFAAPPATAAFWTSTTVIGVQLYDNAWCTILQTGITDLYFKDWTAFVRCVRGRSAPVKGVPPANYLIEQQ